MAVRPSASQYGNPLMWTAQRYDAGEGLYHFLYRTYSPELGRWFQRDPLGYVDGVNSYVYASLNPLFWIDPLGLMDVPWWVKATDPILGRSSSEQDKRVRVICIACEVAQVPADIATAGLGPLVKKAAKKILKEAAEEVIEEAAEKAAKELIEEGVERCGKEAAEAAAEKGAEASRRQVEASRGK